MSHNDLVSGSFDDEGQPVPGRAERPQMNKQWMLAAAGAFVVVFIVAAAGIASLWDSEPDLEERTDEAPPPREYGGPLWFTVGGPDESQLVTNTLPRGVAGPGTAYSGVARYLATEKCFTDGTNLLVWPRGSRPLTENNRHGVNPGDGVDVYEGETVSATGESIVIAETEEFPSTPAACAPSGNAMSLSAVQN